MAKIIKYNEVRKLVQSVDVIEAMREGFIQYSNGNTVVPPVGELLFEDPPGDVHIKYGYIKGDDYYVIKIASGFYGNEHLGIPSGQGLMLLFDQKTGQPVSVLLDNGHLTDIRTAAAGALAVKFFAPEIINSIGVIGTGTQAKMQLLHIQKHNPCKNVWLWGRNMDHAKRMKEELGNDFKVHLATSCKEVAENANVIVTTTPSERPLLTADDIQSGTLIVAVGSDTALKQELDSGILQLADMVIADSLSQSKSRGEIFRAIKNGALSEDKVVELGTAIQSTEMQRSDDNQTIVVDLTGVAVQDIMIAAAVFENYRRNLG